MSEKQKKLTITKESYSTEPALVCSQSFLPFTNRSSSPESYSAPRRGSRCERARTVLHLGVRAARAAQEEGREAQLHMAELEQEKNGAV